MASVVRALFVAWQSPVSRRFFPVARLAEIAGDDCEDCFEFAYINAVDAARKEGFQPFLSFPDFRALYRAGELFPMFANRLLPKTRPDFQEYIEQLGLPSATTSPIVILSRSAGRRATDTLELFPLPTFEPGFGYRTWFWAHGLRHIPSLSIERLLRLQPDEQLFPVCDSQNPVVKNAILLRTSDSHAVGYMPTYLLEDASELQATCAISEVYVERVNPVEVPIQQRLLCRLESCWPEGFTPYSTPSYQPIAADAAEILAPNYELLE